MRRVAWVSAGAASAVAAKMAQPDVIAYCETGAEDVDNARFLHEVCEWIGLPLVRLKSAQYADTWDVWEKRRYLSGFAGAPCTGELKTIPRVAWQQPDDVHIFGYTADAPDARRAKLLRENWPQMELLFPLIEQGVNKSACLAILERAGITPPRVYAMGFEHANCIPCVKATSPSYWSLIRREFPLEFARMAELSRRLGARLARIDGERAFIDEISADHPVTNAIAPACDILCEMAENMMESGT